ncbi:urea ABC transporter permease subunit UrtB [Caldimonas thermodepolymerans]|uniref:Amino acid/amide ABC transporter membrane protein 1 (HAAT family) n=1 Tax=Caldimonas thermodepolymerans TaxID=215580 RepID=A0A2S5T8H4_9BURK|nr:urea ABC transporter permease subunit UrtB [Caldimonas thermodepolymerans]PPE71314.1 urea ABC transporter permease subunit UrtB [Caldimonas thermodepolymerans]QPC33328.1 urea ABC transporter permease subunit UrtB [Caldimonas thermodepolymerans]RDH98878.1 amino acid/amide ABC transporter membrane protein 1 (HAAT family) [Caldimonas thermodepolymerans]TCP06276.1 amino acid/amide ABC transporter membrane protein 1 (HAAT family) [Caldimonas thermodepolymerans]UZG49897.1 urea ABC transporter per
MRLGAALLWLSCLLAGAGTARALTPEQVRVLATGDNDERIEVLNAAVAAADPALQPLVEALLGDEVKTSGEQVYIVRGDAVTDAVTGAPATLPDDAEDVVNSNRMRRALQGALAGLKLLSTQVDERRRAVAQLRDDLDEEQLPLIERAYQAETDAGLKDELARLRATLLIASDDRAQRLEAAQALGGSAQPAVKSLLLARLAREGDAYVEPDAEVRAALQASLRAVESRLAWGERLGVVFSGVSLGSILLLVALGLAITYGLMGVINMAHGELMMIGAYATYVVQNLFRAYLPAAWFDWYIVAAVPVAFAASFAVGAVLERSVIRWLYGRPLETLLATWGISLVLMQAVRSIFGAQNVQVENPSWLSGGVSVMSNLTLPYNRIAIIAFAGLVLLGVTLLIARTRLGLFVRGVTQNRPMAACMGVNTARVDMYAFALGAGIAGLAGCALSQVGNVGPDLGQSYIVDSFLVVVTGGVGQLAGTVYAALGLGVINKILEGWQGAVLAKIMVLLFIVAFIQKRPQGLFAMKGRSAEA